MSVQRLWERPHNLCPCLLHLEAGINHLSHCEKWQSTLAQLLQHSSSSRKIPRSAVSKQMEK
jgi:hypothetical protein